MEETLFYAFGIALVLSALVLSALGLQSRGFPASRIVLAGVVAYFVVLVGATSTFAVLNAREEQRVRDEEHAEEAAEAEAGGEEGTPTAPAGGPTTTAPPQGREQTVTVSSPPAGELVFEPEALTAKVGTVTIEYENPSAVPHSVAIEVRGKTLDESETVTEDTTSATADLQAGEFVFYCTVPGHRESGMEGTLIIE